MGKTGAGKTAEEEAAQQLCFGHGKSEICEGSEYQ